MPTQHPTRLNRDNQTPGLATFLRHSFSQTLNTKHGNINPLSIAYAFQPRLRYRLTLGGVTWPRNPWIFGGRDSRPPYRYLCHHQLLWDLQHSLRYAFIGKHNAPLPLASEFESSVNYLAPLHFRRRTTSPVSYYAFFKGWLLLSQPPGCQSNPTTFPT